MTAYSSVYLFSFLANTFLGLVVFLKNRKSDLHGLFSLFLFSIVGWIFSLYLFYVETEPKTVLWLGRFNFAVSSLMPYLLLRFLEHFPSRKRLFSQVVQAVMLVEVVLLFVISLF